MNKLFILFLWFLIPFQMAYAKKTLNFAPLPLEDIKTMYIQFSPMIKYLEKKLNVKINIVYSSSYDSILKKFMDGKIDLAYLGPLPFIFLESKYKHTVPLVNFKNKKGQSFYTCSFVSFISNKKKTEAISNDKIALTQPLSTCGYLFVNSILKKSNVNIEENRYRYIGRHDKVALSVIRDEFSFGGLKSTIAKEYYHLGLKEIAISKPIPNFILVGNSKTLTKQLLINTKKSMLNVSTEELSLWHKSNNNGVEETNMKNYKNLRKIIKSTKIPHRGNF